MSIVSITAVNCNRCGKAVSPAVACEEPLVVRAWVECPECIQQDEPHLKKLTAAQARESAWVEAALRHYPQNWAFDATNPALVIANIVSGATAEAHNKTGEVESLFGAAMKEIHDVAEGALGYEQVCDAITAVRRLADRCRELSAEREKLEERVAHWQEEYRDAISRYQQVIEERNGLRDVLEKVEWVSDGEGWAVCPWCDAHIGHGHKPDCARQAALTAALKQGGSDD